MSEVDLEGLLPFATPKQAEYLRAVHKHGSQKAAARALGLKHSSSITHAMTALRARAAMQGYAPDHDLTHPAAPGFLVRGTSTLYDESGEKRLQWVKTKADDVAREQAIRDAAEAMSEELPRLPPIDAPNATRDDLCNTYVLTDLHLDMRSWRRETGADWDAEISERVAVAAFEAMIRDAQPAGTALVAILGDLLHSDGQLPVTPASGNVLDRDTRFDKSVGAAIRVLRRVVDHALAKHESVHLVIAEGNHDPASSVWLRQMFAALYEAEPRITVETSPFPFYAFEFGVNMIGFHHGHLKKADQLPMLFASEYPEMWGRTKKRYGHTGHLHHNKPMPGDKNGMDVLQHPTLAARDAYAARHGWRAMRAAQCHTYDRQYGWRASCIIPPELVCEDA